MDGYQLRCPCGSQVSVNAGQCGLCVPCPACRNPIRVPDLITLKSLSGDPYPYLTAIDKVVRAAQAGEGPFDGSCHGCKKTAATVMFPVLLSILEERDLEGHGGVTITPLGQFRKKLAAGTEYWRKVRFPLLLCDHCSASYAKARRSRKWSQLFGVLTFLTSLVLLTWWMTNDTAIVIVVGIAAAFALMAIINRRLQEARQATPIDVSWLSSIRWVDEALRTEDEYQVRVGRVRGLQELDAA